MINLCDSGEESDLEDSKIDVYSQRNMYQLHHQQVFSNDEDQNEDRICNMISDKVNFKQLPSKKRYKNIGESYIILKNKNNFYY